jgi:hypothetical protein
MSIEADFLELMTETATWYPVSSTSSYGARTFTSTGTEITGRYQGHEASESSQQQTDVPMGIFYCYGVYAVSVLDRLVLPDGTVARIVRVGTRPDDQGAHHTVIWVGDAINGQFT